MIKRKESKKSILKIIIMFLIIFILFLLYAYFIGTKGLIVKEYKINASIPDSFDGLKIVHLSDIHYNRTIKEKELKKIVKQVNLINPDIIVITGDILDNDIDATDSKEILIKKK